MGQSAQHAVHTVKEYMDIEERSLDVKHEYWRGDIFAIAGGTLNHAALCASLGAVLRQQLQGKPCAVYSADARVRIYASLGKPSSQDVITYPDVSVGCGKIQLDPKDSCAMIDPVVLVEVLSPSTQKYDRGDKLELYKTISTLHHVVLVAHDKTLVEVVSANAGNPWSVASYGPGQRAALPMLGIALDVDDIYFDPRA